MSQFFNDSVFWIDIEKIKPNPFQPRKEFDEAKLKDLAESIKMYGILQPLVVTRKEVTTADGGLASEYELISGERRLRASKIAGLSQVPTLIRHGEEGDREKLELAIIENLQREDLNPVDRAKAFDRLVTQFGFRHGQIAEKMGKSREYVTNTIRLLGLPQEILDALSQGKVSEGHSRSLLMVNNRPEEQLVLFKEIMLKKLTVRETEAIARRLAFDKVRKKERAFDPEVVEMEERLTEVLGTRVQIEKKELGGKIHIDYFTNKDLKALLELFQSGKMGSVQIQIPSQAEQDAKLTEANRLAAMKAGALDPTVPATPVAKANHTSEMVNKVIEEMRAKKLEKKMAEQAAAAEMEKGTGVVQSGQVEIAQSATQVSAVQVTDEPAVSPQVEISSITDSAPVMAQVDTKSDTGTDMVAIAEEKVEEKTEEGAEDKVAIDDRPKEEIIAEENTDDYDLYSIKNFTV